MPVPGALALSVASAVGIGIEAEPAATKTMSRPSQNPLRVAKSCVAAEAAASGG